MMEDYKARFEQERIWRHRYGGTCREFIVDEGCACSECGGSGYCSYSSTATWRGGVGGQSFTNDVCERCWGSGDASRPWPSHRLAQKEPE